MDNELAGKACDLRAVSSGQPASSRGDDSWPLDDDDSASILEPVDIDVNLLENITDALSMAKLDLRVIRVVYSKSHVTPCRGSKTTNSIGRLSLISIWIARVMWALQKLTLSRASSASKVDTLLLKLMKAWPSRSRRRIAVPEVANLERKKKLRFERQNEITWEVALELHDVSWLHCRPLGGFILNAIDW
jgi:hypothetical protein